jgi:AbrB family looped-hinge helix DNA binding protein
MANVTKLSSKGQVVIPKDARRALQLKEGDLLGVTVVDDLLVMERIEPSGEERIRERLKSKMKPSQRETVDLESLLYPER